MFKNSKAILVTLTLVLILASANAANAAPSASSHLVHPFLVAASDAPQVVKDVAEYLADGTDDDVEIQAAIDALPNYGGKVVLSAGTFSITSAIVPKLKTVLQGQGYSTTIKVANSANLAQAISILNVDGVKLTSFKLDGNKVNQSSGNGAGITVGASSPRTVVVNLLILSTRGRGISLFGTGSDTRVSNNVLGWTGDRSISTDQNDTQILGNRVYNSASHGIWLTGATNSVVTNNVVYNNDLMGLEIFESENVVVTGNIMRDNGRIGIHILKSNGVAVSNNRTVSNDNNGIDCNGTNNISITGNVSSYNGSAALEGNGILVYRCKHVSVTGNVVFNNGQGQTLNRDGIRISDDTSLLAYDVTVTGNRAYDDQATQTQAYGISIHNAGTVNYVVLLGNDVRNNGIAGINTAGLVSGAKTVIAHNLGYVTEAQGFAAITTGNTYVSVTHGLAATPTGKNCSVTPNNGMGSANKFWIDNFNATTFRISVDVDPSVSSATFVWTCEQH